MARFNPAEYQDVNERIKLFYKDHEDGKILTDIVEHTDEYIIVKAELHVGDTVRTTGLAQEFRSFEKEVSKSGGEYEPVNMFNYVENAETSAIGRALANFNYSGAKRPSSEEMNKVERMQGSKPVASSNRPATEKQKDLARKLLQKVPVNERTEYLTETIGHLIPETSAEASKLIESLMSYQPPKEES